ncbi:MAG TPA: hypothetical protein VLQ45_15585 [Thermoanaerobaculia bacterium]|nr:hypothetical protein [Thermoanaerobaculia bacterium]
MMDRPKPVRSLRLAVLVLVGVIGLSNPAEGVGVAGRVLWELGKKVTDLAVGYLAGKVIDHALGQSYEQQLKKVESNLLAEIRNNPGSSHVLRAELESARSQIRVLDAVLRSKPSTQELASLRSKMASDLQELKRALEQQGIRLDQHEQRLDKHDRDLEELDLRIDSLEEAQDRSSRRQRIEEEETSPVWRETADSTEETVPEWRSRAPREVPSFERREPARREARREEGATLTILIRGDSCTIEVLETGSESAADRGSFEVRKARQRSLFRLLAGTGAVITILGDNNRIRVPAGVGRVRIRDLGRNNRKLED